MKQYKMRLMYTTNSSNMEDLSNKDLFVCFVRSDANVYVEMSYDDEVTVTDEVKLLEKDGRIIRVITKEDYYEFIR